VWVGLLAVLTPVPNAVAEEWIAFSTAKTRAIAVGGAYFSAEDELFSAAWNPATFGDPRYVREARFRSYFTPTTSLLAVERLRSRDVRTDDETKRYGAAPSE